MTDKYRREDDDVYADAACERRGLLELDSQEEER